MNKKVTVLKLGGSLLTDKSIPYTLREDTLKTVAQEIKECFDSGLIEALVLIHGVGSYGHPPVLEHNLHKGFKNLNQLIHLSKTQYTVNNYRNMISKAFLDFGIPINLMHTSSIVIGTNMEIINSSFNSLKGFLSLGMVPLIGGDMMYDESMGFSVCSGDQIAVVLSRVLSAKRLLFATDVPGVYDKDPKLGIKLKLYKEININAIDQLLNKWDESKKGDASGKMRGKLHSLVSIKDLIKEGLEVAILSMNKKGVLKKYLKGEEIELTKVVYN